MEVSSEMKYLYCVNVQILFHKSGILLQIQYPVTDTESQVMKMMTVYVPNKLPFQLSYSRKQNINLADCQLNVKFNQFVQLVVARRGTLLV